MNKVLKRLIMLFIGFPAVAGTILLLPYFNNLAINIVAVFFACAGTAETWTILSRKLRLNSKKLFTVLGGVLPAVSWLEFSGFLPYGSLFPTVLILISFILLREVFLKNTEDFPDIIPRVSGLSFVILYPGLFMVYAAKMNIFPHSTMIILIFLIMVFSNDSLAYATGMMFGRNNAGMIKISPNKSIAGFAGGVTGSIAASLLFRFTLPSVYQVNTAWAVLIGFIIGFTVILGDLIESALKRSAEVKDSGTLIPGRGGALDSIDSIIFSFPFFYYLYSAALGL